jgi:1,4-alpha-glucan branching enzyme
LAKAVCEGRRREFAGFAQFADVTLLNRIPDPNAPETFHRSKATADGTRAAQRQQLYRTLLALRRAEIIPRLPHARALDAQAVGPAAVAARWRMADASTLTLASNLGREPATIAPLRDRVLFATFEGAEAAARNGQLAPYSTVALLAPQ